MPFMYPFRDEPQPSWEGVIPKSCDLVAEAGEEAGCGFEGDVDAYVQVGYLYWTCPRCLKEHIEPEPEPDPDYYHDRMMEERYEAR